MTKIRSLTYINDFIIGEPDNDNSWLKVTHKVGNCNGFIGHFDIHTNKIYLSGDNCNVLYKEANFPVSLRHYRIVEKNNHQYNDYIKFILANFIYEKRS